MCSLVNAWPASSSFVLEPADILTAARFLFIFPSSLVGAKYKRRITIIVVDESTHLLNI